MNNQVAALRAINIRVATINSNVHLADRDDIFKDMRCGAFCLMVPLILANAIDFL